MPKYIDPGKHPERLADKEWRENKPNLEELEELDARMWEFRQHRLSPYFEWYPARFLDGLSHAQRTYCRDFEVEFYRCAAPIGMRRAAKECWGFWEDFQECMTQRKQKKRYVAMQKIRKEKGLPFKPMMEHDAFIDHRFKELSL